MINYSTSPFKSTYWPFFFFLHTLFILLFKTFGSDCLILTAFVFGTCFSMICFVIFDVLMSISLL